MKLIEDKNKIRWNKTGRLIIDPTLDFNKRLNVESLNKKFGKRFQKSMILKIRDLVAFLKVNLFVENLCEEEKQYS